MTKPKKEVVRIIQKERRKGRWKEEDRKARRQGGSEGGRKGGREGGRKGKEERKNNSIWHSIHLGIFETDYFIMIFYY